VLSLLVFGGKVVLLFVHTCWFGGERKVYVVTPDEDFWIQPPKASPMMMNLLQPAVILPLLLQQEQELEGIEHVSMDME
jgi:hypothetical protein